MDERYISPEHDNLPEGDVCNEGCDLCLGDELDILPITDDMI